MSVKKYGIYIAWPPGVNLAKEGLGRHLASFIKGASGNVEVKFLIACPSWSTDGLQKLFDEEQVPRDGIEILHPARRPTILTLFEMIRRRPSKSRLILVLQNVLHFVAAHSDRVTTRLISVLVRVNSLVLFALIAIFLLPFILILTVVAAAIAAMGFVFSLLHHAVRFRWVNKLLQIPALQLVAKAIARVKQLTSQPTSSSLVVQVYREMERIESDRIVSMIEQRSDVRAWYCPTAFWPAFNSVSKPKLICVPDVVLEEFPVGFANLVGAQRIFSAYELLRETIDNGSFFVTYSNHIKWKTLVERHAIKSTHVSVVRHAPNNLDTITRIEGYSDNEQATDTYCLRLLRSAFLKSKSGFQATDGTKFIFYASQFRPNKNVAALIKAYNHLLRERFISHKLLLTGNPDSSPEILRLVNNLKLERDVIFLHGLSIKELSACYRLADLAVNPSFSEGGCPFTFTEALSVGTPVVMARIPVAEEVLTDPELQRMTFFDPMDWKDMANRIKWGLDNRARLLEVQMRTFNELSKRTWQDVAAEHIEILEGIANHRPALEVTQNARA